MMIAAAVSTLIFTAVGTAAGLTYGLLFGRFFAAAFFPCLLAGGFAAYHVFYRLKRSGFGAPLRPGAADILCFILFGLFCVAVFGGVYFEREGSIFAGNKIFYGSLSGPLSLIFHFLHDSFSASPTSVMGGSGPQPAFGTEFFLALLAKTGLPLYGLLPLAGILFGLLLVFALLLWGRRFTLAGFFFAGGLAGYRVISEYKLLDFEASQFWQNLFLTVFLRYWGFWYALPAGLFLLLSWRKRLLEGAEGLPISAEALLLGLMPLFDVPTFLALFWIYMVWSLFGRRAERLLSFYFVTLGLALPSLYLSTGHFTGSSVQWLDPAWLTGGGDPFSFLAVNFGIGFPMAIITAALAVRRKDRAALLTVMAAFSLILFCLFIRQDSARRDALPLAMWAYLLLLPLINRYLIRPLWFYPRFGIVFLFCFSGIVSTVFFIRNDWKPAELIGRSRAAEVCHEVRSLADDAGFATAPVPYPPLLFCGRKIASGFLSDGTGSSTSNSEAYRLGRLMKGEAGWEKVAREKDVRYLFWGPDEIKTFPDSNRPWESEKLKVAQGEWGKIYDLDEDSPFAQSGEWAAPLNGGEGLTARYYREPSLKGTVEKTFVVRGVDFSRRGTGRELTDAFGVIFDGLLYVPIKGDTEFYLASDDGSELTIDGRKVVEQLKKHPLRVRSGRISLEAGWHPVSVRYFNSTGDAALRLWWKLPGRDEEKMPSGNFRIQTR